MRVAGRAFMILTALSLSTAALPALAETPAEAWEQIRSSRLDPARAVAVEGLEIDLGMAVLELSRGTLIPATPVAGRTVEVIFVGDGHFRIEPPDRLEKQQLRLFTGQSELDAPVRQVVLTLGATPVVERLLDRPALASPEPAILQQAAEAFGQWTGGAERRTLGVEAAILGSTFDEARADSFFAAWCRSDEHGDFYYLFDPAEQEQVVLGQFVPIEADYYEETRIKKSIRRQKRSGRYRQLRFEDLGNWDTWISTALRSEDGEYRPGSSGVRSESYTLEVDLDPKEQSMAGQAGLTIQAERAGIRVLTFRLFPDLEVQAVRDDSGAELAWFRADEDLFVTLAEPTVAGGSLTVNVSYAGTIFDEFEPKIYRLLDTYAWYPRVGGADRATYDVTLRWPRKLTLLASGRRIDGGEEGATRWERRKLDLRSSAFSFEVGAFDIVTDRVGHVEITMGISRARGSFHKGAREEALDTLKESLAFFEEEFGPYPLDYLTVAMVPRSFSQGFQGFLTLSQFLIWEPSARYWIIVREDRDQSRWEARTETIAHELAHQWWGNKVGWDSYRDQWLSESLADFSAVFFTSQKADRKAVYLARHGGRWRGSLLQRTSGSRTLESLGPVVMGSRLHSSHSRSAYQAVTYDKGSVVFSMLARALGEEPFAAMLKALANAVDHRLIDTATFLQAIERMSGLPMDEFADRFIYGTGIPEIYYTYEFRQAEDGGWVVQGEARQVAPARSKYELRRTSSETWSVAREGAGSMDVGKAVMAVPFQISLAAATDEETTLQRFSRAETTTQRGLGGTLIVQGEVTPFMFRIDSEPEGFWLDQRGEVLATFYCEQRQPKRMLRYRAVEVAGQDRFEEAEALFRRALEADLVSADAREEYSDRQLERESLIQDAWAHVGLARLYLDQGRDGEAREALDEAEALIPRQDRPRFRRSNVTLRGHLEVRAGDYKSAYDALSKELYLEFTAAEGESLSEAARRRRFRTGNRWRGSGRAYALLAVSAFETGHLHVAREALDEAEKRGADMAPLSELLADL